MLPKLAPLLAAPLVGLIACGSGTSHVDTTKGKDSGASTGGAAAAGTGGANGSGGSGTTSDAGSTGGGSTADAGGGAGTAGSMSSGGTTGSGGTAGAAAGGAATGGSSSGSGGTGLSDSGTTTGRCASLCAGFTDAACSSGPTRGGCLLTCRALTSSSSCNDKANAYFDCADGATTACTAAGEPFEQGCGVQYLQAIACSVSANPNPAVVAPCSDNCDKIGAAACANSAPKAECNTRCLWAGATGTGCDDEWQAYLTCANAAQYTCLLGFAVAQGCGPAFRTYTACINAAGTPP